MAKTRIEWTDESSNPIHARRLIDGKRGWHCTKVSPGCANCYAEAMNKWRGTGLAFSHTSTPWVETYSDHPTLERLARLKGLRRVFICDMTDLFGEHVTDSQILDVWGAMERSSDMPMEQRPTFQVLTKRPERMLAWVDKHREWCDYADEDGAYMQRYAHIWLGTSVENQLAVEQRVSLLLGTPGSMRFLSCEPLLGPIDLLDYLPGPNTDTWCAAHGARSVSTLPRHCSCGLVNWVIVGGESGSNARPCSIDWIRDIVSQCRAAQVPVFVKQLGAVPYQVRHGGKLDGAKEYLPLKDRKGGDMNEWPDDLRIREFPQAVPA